MRKSRNRFIHSIFSLLGYDILLYKQKKSPPGKNSITNLNVGAGNYVIPGFDSLDYFTEHYYPSASEFSNKRVPYDIRNDKLPYDDETVDNIYISHVVEHIENFAVEKFIQEAYRVLKKDGVLRIVCPDSRFLYKVSQFNNDYYCKSGEEKSAGKPDQYDSLLRLIATRRSRLTARSPEEILDIAEARELPYQELLNKLKSGITFDENFPGEHINCWDAELLEKIGKVSGFSHILESRFQASVSQAMRGVWFDRTHPEMSLYMDMVK